MIYFFTCNFYCGLFTQSKLPIYKISIFYYGKLNNIIFHTMAIVLYLSLLLHLSYCTLAQIGTIGNGIDPILAFSSGTIHITLAYSTGTGTGLKNSTNSSSPTVKQIDLFNISSNTTITLAIPPPGLSLTNLQQFPTNNATNNSYIVQDSNGNGMVWRNNFTVQAYGWAAGQDMVVDSCFAANTSFIYQLVDSGGVCSVRVVNVTNQSYTDAVKLTGTCIDIAYYNGSIYTITGSATGLINLTIYKASRYTLIQTKTFYDPQNTQNYKLKLSGQYFSLAISNTAYLYHTTNYTSPCNITLNTNTTIHDISLTNQSIFISYLDRVEQYSTASCHFFGGVGVAGLPVMEVKQPSVSSPNTRVFVLSGAGAAAVDVLRVWDRYPCAGGCASCIEKYAVDNATVDCYFVGKNYPTSSTPTTTPTPTPATSTTLPAVYISSACLTNGEPYCQQLCDYKCNSCLNSSTACQTCSLNRLMNENLECTASVFSQLASTALNTLNTFRPTSIQFVFFLLDNFQLYQYHQTNYTGIFSNILQQINNAGNLKWSLISVDSVLDWTKRSSFATLPYNAFTNEKFLEVERQSALLFDTAKAYYAVYVPAVCVGFLLLNRLFYLTTRFRVSRLLRPYSFWMQLLVLVGISDSSRLSFLALNYLQLLFSQATWLRLAHAAAIIFIGLFFLATLLFFPLSSYFYGPLSKYFLFNLMRLDFSFTYAFLRYSLRPFIEAALHVLLFRYPQCQLLSLISVEIVFLLFTLTCQLHFKLFRNKTLFFFESVLSSQIILVLLINYTKQIVFFDDEQIVRICESSLKTSLFIAMAIIVLSVMHPILQVMIFLIFKKASKRNRNSQTILHFQTRKIEQTNKQTSIVTQKTKDQRFSLMINRFITQDILKSKEKEMHVQITVENLEDDFMRHRTEKYVKK